MKVCGAHRTNLAYAMTARGRWEPSQFWRATASLSVVYDRTEGARHLCDEECPLCEVPESTAAEWIEQAADAQVGKRPCT